MSSALNNTRLSKGVTRKMLKDLLILAGKLRKCLGLFTLATLVLIIWNLAETGIAVVSLFISSAFFSDTQAELQGLFILLFSLVVVYPVFNLLDIWLAHDVANRILHILRVSTYSAINRIAPLGLQNKRTADIASAALSDTSELEWFYTQILPSAIFTIVNSIIFTTILTWLIGPIGLFMIIPMILTIIFPFVLVPIQRRQGVASRETLVDLRAAVLNAVQGQRELRSLGMVKKQHEVVIAATERVQKIKNAHNLRKALELAFSSLVTAAGSIILLIILTDRVLNGQLDGRILPVAILLAGLSVIPSYILADAMGRMGDFGACAMRINKILKAKDPIPTEPRRGLEKHHNEDNTLVADDIGFSYDSQPVLSGVNLTVSPSRSVAIVGHSGAGKSTLANLAMRFLDPDDGEMRFDGLNLHGYNPDVYRQRLSLVSQDCHIFAGTIRQNLELAKDGVSDDAIWEALKLADIATLVESLGGLDAPVGDRGTTLSGGERQRIGIARAFLRNPDMLILDEPLANIDPLLEANIAANVRRLRGGRTTIVIAHRLASIRIADHIIVLDNGGVVAQGTHKKLLNNMHYLELLGNQIQQ
ncbi:MAG: ABC transporter ATP-binding protein/permease [Tropheryma whipplei]|nr:ABC transporter ATP-binding protein/permease [Tropheryma whipplei]